AGLALKPTQGTAQSVEQNSSGFARVRPELEQAQPLGAVEDQASFDLILSLRIEKRAELDTLIGQLHDPSSTLYHQWLSPQEFGERFGASQADYERIKRWLKGQGFELEGDWPSRLQINFRATAAQIAKALHTRIKRYKRGEQYYFANDR